MRRTWPPGYETSQICAERPEPCSEAATTTPLPSVSQATRPAPDQFVLESSCMVPPCAGTVSRLTCEAAPGTPFSAVTATLELSGDQDAPPSLPNQPALKRTGSLTPASTRSPVPSALTATRLSCP